MIEVKKQRCGTRMARVRRRLCPLLLAVLCPVVTYADGDVGIKATVCEGTTVRESAQFRLSKTPRISFDSDGKLVMKLGDSNTNVAELPMKNGAELHVTMQDYDESQNKFTANVSSAGYSTLYSAFQLTIPSDVEAYAPEYNAEKNVLKLNDDTKVAEGIILPAGTGIVLKNQGEYDFIYSDTEPAQVKSSLTGSVVSAPVTDFNGNIYSLAKEDDVVAFYKYAQSMTVAGKAFLVLTNGQQSKKVIFAYDDIVNDIDVISNDEFSNGPIYNLVGQIVGKSYRGIIIHNGKKLRR